MKAEIRWLPNSLLKDIPYPKIAYDTGNFGGYYTHGSGILTLNPDGRNIESTIAHEFCHYLQDLKGRLKGTKPPHWPTYYSRYGYEDAIHHYYKNKIEYEALIFENKHAKDDYNEWWLRKLVRNE